MENYTIYNTADHNTPPSSGGNHTHGPSSLVQAQNGPSSLIDLHSTTPPRLASPQLDDNQSLTLVLGSLFLIVCHCPAPPTGSRTGPCPVAARKRCQSYPYRRCSSDESLIRPHPATYASLYKSAAATSAGLLFPCAALPEIKCLF
jgi:hypothetical protein